MEVERAVLGTVDYIIFAVMLLVSAGIGVFFRFSGGKQKTTEEYLLAGKDMAILPVAFSLMASFLSAITVIGIPSEMYQFGIHMAYMNIGFTIGTLLSSYIFLPVFFEMQTSTAYEYLERRFGKLTRTLSSLAFVLQMILYMSVVLYAPALALSAVTNLSTWVSVISIGVVCTFYCTMGGMKAVLWTDVFQAILMFLGIFAVLIKGLIDVGGIANVFRIANDGGRLVVPGFEVNPEVRYTMWNILMQGLILSMSAFGGNQVQIQRMLTVKNVSRARTALFVSIPMGCSFHLLNCLAGIVVYAYFSNCDPMTSPNKPISSGDQLLPFFMASALSQYPGLAGLCICGIFSASLSTVSSAVNSLTAVTMQDLVRPLFVAKGVSEKKTAFSAKAITLFYGLLCVSLTFLVATFGNLVQASLTMFGLLGGPVLAIFFLGMMTERSNQKGAIVGLIVSIAFTAWISFGASANAPSPEKLPVSIEGCTSGELMNSTMLPYTTLALFNSTDESLISSSSLLSNTTISSSESSNEYLFPLYRISYMWFAPIGFLSCVIVGYVSSIIFSIISGLTEDVPREYLSPVLKFFLSDKKEFCKKNEVKISGPIELEIVNGISNGSHKLKEKETI
ncbi:putative sodium-dependent multivitamin transporter [Uloborus diversus]|uniref:putative sodium-dependent multivitamin transporter n=1 Tax=Uloborus diversus TaxID=327109 RepID=UPI002409D535|nr:putative sodium-dependent multivitamin transporter [Uloborus diversus]